MDLQLMQEIMKDGHSCMEQPTEDIWNSWNHWWYMGLM